MFLGGVIETIATVDDNHEQQRHVLKQNFSVDEDSHHGERKNLDQKPNQLREDAGADAQ